MAGAECCVPAPECEHESSGSEELIDPFLSYVSRLHAAPKAAVILVSDILGFESPLLRKLADKIAALGYLVVVPDFFEKDPFDRDAGVPLADWLKKHQPIDAVEGMKNMVQILKSKGLPSVGAVGFCWGAKVVADLAKEDHLKAAILCHPSYVTVEDIQDIKTPIAILAAEIDKITPSALVKQFSEVLESKEEVQSFVKIYPGATHGWVIRYDANNAKAIELAEEAHQKIFDWLETFLQ